MRRVNFRALIFIDLLASAMGAAILLMLIFATAKKTYPFPAGKPREFILYKVKVPNGDIKIKIFVYDSLTRNWAQSNFYNEDSKKDSVSIFSQYDKENNINTKVKMWGPCLMQGLSDSVVYNVYIPSPKNSKWIFSVLYLDHAKLLSVNQEQKFEILNKKIDLEQDYRTSTNIDSIIISKDVSYGNVIDPPIVLSLK